MCAPVIHVFCPLITNAAVRPLRPARQVAHVRSRPRAPTSRSRRSGPATIPPRISSFSASVPNSSTGRPDIMRHREEAHRDQPARELLAQQAHVDRATARRRRTPRGSPPPASRATAICAYSAWLCGSRPPSVSASRCSRVPHSRRAKSRIASTNARCSSDRFWIGIACRDYSPGMLIRDADAERDAGACAALYAPYVRDTPISLEDARPPQELADRIETTKGRTRGSWPRTARPSSALPTARATGNAPLSLGHRGDRVRGTGNQRRGVGRALYQRCSDSWPSRGSASRSPASRCPTKRVSRLHESLGFEPVGVYRRIGWKQGAW